jgi:hypothetical protein
MTRRGSSARAAALRRAQEAKAARDAERLRREKLIEAGLADYYEAAARAERVRAGAQRKADVVLGDAENTAGEHVAAARDAVRGLRDLLGGNAEVASLCGLTASAVRAMLAGGSPDGAPRAAAAPRGPEPGAGVSGHGR